MIFRKVIFDKIKGPNESMQIVSLLHFSYPTTFSMIMDRQKNKIFIFSLAIIYF